MAGSYPRLNGFTLQQVVWTLRRRDAPGRSSCYNPSALFLFTDFIDYKTFSISWTSRGRQNSKTATTHQYSYPKAQKEDPLRGATGEISNLQNLSARLFILNTHIPPIINTHTSKFLPCLSDTFQLYFFFFEKGPIFKIYLLGQI